jgi:hypothetical protein
MYSRKQFILKALQKVTQLVGDLPLCSSPFHEPEPPNPNGIDTEKLFQKAMELGIDPGTMDIIQLTQIVQQEGQVDTKTNR